MPTEIVFAGISENVEAECSYRSDLAYSIILFCDGEPISAEGYNDVKSLNEALKEYQNAQINYYVK